MHPDTFSLKVLGRIIAGDKTTRLYRAIIDKGLATNVEIDFQRFKENSLFIVYVTLTKVKFFKLNFN
jgi:predicted Zn-dependent peptidase